MDRRSSKRAVVDIFLNKYIDGYPYTCRTLDISHGGILIQRIQEPKTPRDFFPIEVALPGSSHRIWIWARTVWIRGETQALRFTGIDPYDQVVLDQFVEQQAKAA